MLPWNPKGESGTLSLLRISALIYKKAGRQQLGCNAFSIQHIKQNN